MKPLEAMGVRAEQSQTWQCLEGVQSLWGHKEGWQAEEGKKAEGRTVRPDKQGQEGRREAF